MTVDGHGAISILDAGIVDEETVRRLTEIAKVAEEHPLGDAEFMVLPLGHLCEILGKEEPWFEDSLVVVWVLWKDDDRIRLVVTDLLFE